MREKQAYVKLFGKKLFYLISPACCWHLVVVGGLCVSMILQALPANNKIILSAFIDSLTDLENVLISKHL